MNLPGYPAKGDVVRLVLSVIAVSVIVIGAVTWAARVGSTVDIADGVQPWSQDTMQFVAWNNQRWTAWIRDGEFVFVPENERRWSRHSKATIAFIDWQGEPWQARISGDLFVLAPRGDWENSALSSTAIRYQDWSGAARIRTVQQLAR
jgi:hypothetical protein